MTSHQQQKQWEAPSHINVSIIVDALVDDIAAALPASFGPWVIRLLDRLRADLVDSMARRQNLLRVVDTALAVPFQARETLRLMAGILREQVVFQAGDP